MKIRAGIIGGAGYTGGETLRLLLYHPDVDVTFVHSRSNAGKKLSSVHTDLLGETDMKFSDQLSLDVDVLFLCLGHGESRVFLEENAVPGKVKVIDLGNDFRLSSTFNSRDFVYGLPEANREAIRGSDSLANPGCFATAIQLSLLPLVKSGFVGEVYTTGITGSTGAGQKLQETTHFTWRANNISTYKTLTHQHLGEINRTLTQVNSSFKGQIQFVPWRGDFTRGIFTSSTLKTERPLEEIRQMYVSYYDSHAFTKCCDEQIDLKQVVNTNKCHLSVEKSGEFVVVHAALDNLLKGASGQAVQNMNLMFGLDESQGLKLKSIGF